MYKSKLQELCHSKSWKLPKYIIIKNGPNHYPNFGASITVNDIIFQTQAPLKSSKMAQNEIAKLALDHFSTMTFQQTAPLPTIATTLLPPSQPLMPIPSQQPSLQQQHQETSWFNLFPQPSMPNQVSHQPLITSPPDSFESSDMNDKLSGVSISTQILKDKAQLTVVNAMSSVLNDDDNDAHKGSDCGLAGGSSNFNCGGIQDDLESFSTVPLCHLSSASEGTPSKRICIYPRSPNMTHPEGSVVLPESDDKWVALSLSGNQDYFANV